MQCASCRRAACLYTNFIRTQRMYIGSYPPLLTGNANAHHPSCPRSAWTIIGGVQLEKSRQTSHVLWRLIDVNRRALSNCEVDTGVSARRLGTLQTTCLALMANGETSNMCACRPCGRMKRQQDWNKPRLSSGQLLRRMRLRDRRVSANSAFKYVTDCFVRPTPRLGWAEGRMAEAASGASN